MRALILSALCLALCACVDRDEPEPAPRPNPHAGTSWIMQGTARDRPTIEFTDSRASGTTGCNRWFAQVIAGESGITFTAMGTTRRMCDATLMEGEHTFIAALRETRTARVEGGVLVLHNGAGAELARFDRVE